MLSGHLPAVALRRTAVAVPLQVLAFLGIASAIAVYSLWTGPIAFMGDSYLFADRAKHLWQLGNLDLNNHGNLIYPPLYAIVLSPVYALRNAASVLIAISLLNSVFVASTVFPLFRLVTEYGGLTGRACWFFVLLIGTSAAFVAYAPMVLSEAFFIPLVYWTTYALFRSLSDLTPRWFVVAGLLIAAGLLTRSAATGVLLSGCGAWIVGLFFILDVKRSRAWALLAAGLMAALGPVIVWHWFERHYVTYQNGMDYSISQSLRVLAGNPTDQWIKLHWTLNGGLYFLLAPLNLGGFLAVAVMLRHPRFVVHDPLLPFMLGVIVLSIASIVVLAPTGYGGNPLTWNKYFAPFIGLVTLAALRLRTFLSWKEAGIAAALALAVVGAGRPAAMVCHFPDALTAFMDSAYPLPIPAATRNGLFFLFSCSSLPLFMPSANRRVWRISAMIAASLALFSTAAAARYWQGAGALNFAHYSGLAVNLREAAQRNPDLPIFYDPDMLSNDGAEAQRFLFYYPKVLSELPLSALFRDDAHLLGRFLYVSRAILPSAEVRSQEGESLRLYMVDAARVRHDLAYRISYGDSVGGPEHITVNGQPVTVRWLGIEPTLIIHVNEPVSDADLYVQLAICDHARTVTAALNGVSLPTPPAVRRVAWQDGFDSIIWHVSLHAGENQLTLKNDAEAVTLPDGIRKVTFLLKDAPVLVRP